MSQRALEIAWYVAFLAVWVVDWALVVGGAIHRGRKSHQPLSLLRLAMFVVLWAPLTAVLTAWWTTKMLL